MSSSSSLLPPTTVLQKFCGDTAVLKGGGVKLTDVNPHLVCVLCHGYFVDATSIVECLHSFCRSCIVLHLDKKSFCPICEEEIQNSKALKPDKALQDIVYKLVPGLFHSEMKRRQEFYQKHPHRDMHLHPESRGVSVDRIVYTADELISLSLEFYDKECEQEMWKNVTDDKGLHYMVRTEKPQKCVVRKRYLKCPAAVRMSHLKKFIRLKYNLKPSDYVELLYRRESLPEEYSIMDIAYIYTWNRNEPMRFFYKINAHVVVPVMPVKGVNGLTDVVTIEPDKSLKRNHFIEMTQSPSSIKTFTPTNLIVDTLVSPSSIVETSVSPSPLVKTAAYSNSTVKEQTKAVTELLKQSVVDEQATVKSETPSKTESILEPMVKTVKLGMNKKDRRSTPPPPMIVSSMPLNPPISPEGTSRKENVSDNIRNSCANELSKVSSAVVTSTEEKKIVDTVEQQQISTTTDVPMKKLEKLVEQQQQMSPISVSTSIAIAPATTSASAVPLPKKPIAVGESKLNLSISKLILKNQNASATTKFVPTQQQMQQIGMHTSIPTFQQQQLQQLPSPQPNAYVRPGFPGMHQFKRSQDVVPIRSQAPTNRPPFIPVRKSYEWNKARNLAAKPLPSPTAIKDNKITEKLPSAMAEKPTKKTTADYPPTSVAASALPVKNSDEINAAQSLLKVGQDLRHVKPPMISDLHDKYNCESSLQITKVTELETNPPPTVHEKSSSSQPSLQIMRMPPATEKSSTKPISTEPGNGSNNCVSNSVPLVTNKPINKKPVPSLYSMPTNKRMKEDHLNHNGTGSDSKRIERRVDTENGVLSVSLLTETSKQDMDAKRREVVQPDVSIKLMTFPTESAKKTPDLNPICGGNGGANNKRKLDEPNPNGSSAIKRKQEEPDRPPRPAQTKDDVPQLIEINSSPYAKLLPTKKQQLVPKHQPVPKQQSVQKQQSVPKQQLVSKQLPVPKQQTSPKQQSAAYLKVLDLSKSPPNGGLKRPAASESISSSSPCNKIKTTSPVQQLSPSNMVTATSAASAVAFNSNFLFAAQRQAAAFLLKQHFDSLNNGLMRNGTKGPAEWPRAMFNPSLFARPPTNMNN